MHFELKNLKCVMLLKKMYYVIEKYISNCKRKNVSTLVSQKVKSPLGQLGLR